MQVERGQVRKVRASQGRMPDNVRRRRLQGKCNREIPPAGRLCARLVRVERQCKRLPFLWQQRKPCKPHPKQDRIENHVAARHVFRLVAGGHWRQCHWIDDYTRHNPAYRSASQFDEIVCCRGGGREISCSFRQLFSTFCSVRETGKRGKII